MSGAGGLAPGVSLRSMVTVVGRVCAGLSMLVGLACVVAPAPPPAPATAARPPVASAPAPYLGHGQGRPRATEVGFTHCCGSEQYKLEIDCGEMVMRCYRRSTDGHWRFTYGRLCHEHLGDSCYPSGCEDACPMRGSR